MLMFFVLWCVVSSPWGVNGEDRLWFYSGDSRHTQKVADKIKGAGIRYVRCTFPWESAQRDGPGQWNWDRLDRNTKAFAKSDLQVVGVLAYCPNWAISVDPDTILGFDNRHLYSPRSVMDWRTFVAKTVERCDGDGFDDAPGSPVVKFWQMWNEPNISYAPSGTWLHKPACYRDSILKVGSEAARSADSECIILLGSIIDYPNWYAYLDTVFQDGGFGYFDIVAFHSYYLDCPPRAKILPRLDSLHTLVQRYGDKPIWITETGAYTFSGDPNDDHVSVEVQAKYLTEMCSLVDSLPYVDKVFFFEFFDDSSRAVRKYGICYHDLTPKPAYYAYKEYIRQEKNGE